jgi:lambda repressor-like predicted transcriptional regulator
MHLTILTLLLLAGGTPQAIPEKASAPEVYLYGNPISAPYRVEQSGAIVRINGIQIHPPLTEPAQESTRPLLAPSAAANERYEFREEGWSLQHRLEQEGKCCSEISEALAEHYRSRGDLVAKVRDVQANSFWVSWVNGVEEEILIVPSGRAQTPEEDARAEVRYIEHVLKIGCIVIIGSSARVVVPPDDAGRLRVVRSEIDKARRAPKDLFGSPSRAYLDNRWDGKYLPAEVARQFASPLTLTDWTPEE